MHLYFRNVNMAFDYVVQGIREGFVPAVPSPSRYGNVRVIPEPLTITYLNPLDRVLFNPGRDCNPFFHLFEALWMLAGRNDVAPLAYYSGKIASFSDDGETLNGAYGYRWRHGGRSDTNQLQLVINELKERPESRRVVLQMWTVEDDLLKIDPRVSKDVCCNLSCMFLLNPQTKHLDLTVINRSNDLCWGTFGANVVHMAYLLEYVACCVGVPVGVYHQISNNAHVYDATFTPEKWEDPDHLGQFYGEYNWTVPLVRDQATFDRECAAFIDDLEGNWEEPYPAPRSSTGLYGLPPSQGPELSGSI